MTVHCQLLIGPDVKQATCGVVAARRERVTVGEEGYGVYVRLVAREGLLADSFSYVPQFGGGVAGARHEGPHVVRQREGHDVARVTEERRDLLSGLDVPKGAAHVARAGHYLVVVEEAAAAEVARVAGQLPRYLS